LLLIYFLFAFCLVNTALASAGGAGRTAINMLIRVLGTPVACLMLVGVGLRAAGALSGERERRTLDALLSSPLENRAILLAKGLASIASVRRAWWFLGGLGLMGLLTGGLEVTALPLWLLAWTVYAILVAGVGLWFSLV